MRRGAASDNRGRRSFERLRSGDERKSNDEGTQREKEPEPIPERRIDVEIPRIVSDLGSDTHFVKLPNFLSVETRPFDAQTNKRMKMKTKSMKRKRLMKKDDKGRFNGKIYPFYIYSMVKIKLTRFFSLTESN